MPTFVQGMLWLGLVAAVACGHEGTHTLVDRKSREIQDDPGNARLLFERAELFRDHRDWDDALADYLRAERLDPTLDEVLLGKGRLYLAAGWYQAAAFTLEGYLVRQPADSKGHRYHAEALTRSGRLSDGVAAYTRAIRDAGRFDADLYLERAAAQRGMGRDQYDAALRGLDDGMARAGHPAVALQLAAIEIELELGRFDEALLRLESLADASPRKEQWLERRGAILKLAGRDKEARQAYADAWAAIEALPPHRRRVPAVSELEARVKAAMQPERSEARESGEGN